MTGIKEKVFSFDQLEEVVEQYFDESEERAGAALTYENGVITLTTCKFRECEIVVYHAKETKEIYESLDTEYLNILENGSTGNDFWDMWNAIINVFDNYKIVDEVLNP